MGLLFPYIPKKYKYPMCDVTMMSYLPILPNLANFRSKSEIFVKKVLNIGIAPFLLRKKEIMFLTYTVRFKTIL